MVAKFVWQKEKEMSLSRKCKRLMTAGTVLAVPMALGLGALTVGPTPVQGSDHADTAENVSRPGTDLADLYIFPSPRNASNVVFAMDVHPLIPAGRARGMGFDPGVLYQFKIDTTGDGVEDLVMQARFEGTGERQRVLFAGPVKPSMLGTSTRFSAPYATTGTINKAFTPSPGIEVFAGARDDPFFLDFERFITIFPDRGTGLEPPLPRTQDKNTPNPNAPRLPGWRPKGQARDFFRGFNVLSIVVELPKALISRGKIGVWITTSVAR